MSFLFSLPLILILLLALAAVSFFFSASETSVIALSKLRLRHMVAQGIKRAQNIQSLVIKLDQFIITILVGNNFVNIAISSIITAICVNVLGNNWGVLVATLVSAFLLLIFCEITPKILSIKHTEKVALFIAPWMEKVVVLLHPVVHFFTGVSELLFRVFKVEPAKRSPLVTEEELRLMIEVGKEEGVLSEEENKMLHRIFEFGDTRISEVMVQRDKMSAVNINSTPEQLLNIFVEEGHARLPVYSGKIENIIGVIYARDLLYILRDRGLFLLSDLVHKAYYVSSTIRVNELLREFQKKKIQIAIVVDEQNSAMGLVTLEDLLEEIVGEIEEERV